MLQIGNRNIPGIKMETFYHIYFMQHMLMWSAVAKLVEPHRLR